MRGISISLITIGVICNFIISGVAFGIISICFAIWAIYSLATYRKNIFCGICCLVFVSLLGGIIYLCWKPTEEEKERARNE